MKIVFVVQACFVLALCSFNLFAQTQRLPNFEQHRAKVYSRKIKAPKWMTFEDGVSRNEGGKLVDPLEINFAGKYYIGRHSCGTECRYYTLTDLSTGKELNVLSPFAATEAKPRKNGDIPILYGRRNSNLLIVQFMPGFGSKSQCRERPYLLVDKALKPLTKLIGGCRRFD